MDALHVLLLLLNVSYAILSNISFVGVNTEMPHSLSVIIYNAGWHLKRDLKKQLKNQAGNARNC